MFHKKDELTHDLEKLLKEEGDFVQELSDVATKAAQFHARLEAIEKAIESDPASYHSKEANKLVKEAEDKYSSELENRMKDAANETMNRG